MKTPATKTRHRLGRVGALVSLRGDSRASGRPGISVHGPYRVYVLFTPSLQARLRSDHRVKRPLQLPAASPSDMPSGSGPDWPKAPGHSLKHCCEVSVVLRADLVRRSDTLRESKWITFSQANNAEHGDNVRRSRKSQSTEL